jgi:hypothetical protein
MDGDRVKTLQRRAVPKPRGTDDDDGEQRHRRLPKYDRRVGKADAHGSDDSTSSDEDAAGARRPPRRAPRGAAPAHAITPLERDRFKRQKTISWVDAMPLRMRQFVEHNDNAVALRIYRELVVHLPMRNAGEAEVVGLCEAFGEVEYVSKMTVAAAAGGGGGGGASAVGVDAALGAGFAHLVRFEEGMDAVRCFFGLNGAVIDPLEYNSAIEQMALMLSGNGAGGEGEGGEEGEVDVERAKQLLRTEDLLIASCDANDGTRLIFVGVEFFRMAFTEPTADGGVAARSALVSGRSSIVGRPTGKKKAARPAKAPTQVVAERLAAQADEAPALFPCIKQDDRVSWEQYCEAANLIAFLHVTPSPEMIPKILTNAKLMAAKQQQRPGGAPPKPPVPEGQAPEVEVASYFTVAHEALKRARFDPDHLRRLIDVSADTAELMTGSRHRTTAADDVKRVAYDALTASPYVTLGVFVFFFLASTVAVWLVISQ